MPYSYVTFVPYKLNMKNSSPLTGLFVHQPLFEWLTIEEDLLASTIKSDGDEKSDLQLLPQSILICCCLEGQVQLQTSFSPQPLNLHPNEATVIAYPRAPWHCQAVLKDAHIVFFGLSLQKLHDILAVKFDASKMSDNPAFDYRMLPDIIPFSPLMQTDIKQIFQNNLGSSFMAIFQKAKFLEIFSTLMNQAFRQPVDECPFVISMELEEKLSDVRRLLTQNLSEVPDIDELSLQCEMPKSMLQKGFRYLYGKTIHSYYQDTRMDQAMAMLESGQYLVKEIAYELGYQNPSHFIAAFKKKFEITPKQYLKQAAAV